VSDSFEPDRPRFLLRAATPQDLDAYERLARASSVGITTLPANRSALADRLERSAQAFASSDDASGEEIYVFVLEDQAVGQIVGTSAITARAGFTDRFYSYRNEMVVHTSAALETTQRIHTLHLCHDLSDHSLLSSFYIDPAYEDTLAPQLLSRGRLLFIAEHLDRFSDRIASESPGLADDSGRCPFWDAVGRRFFEMDYASAERLAGGRHKAFIAELMPQAPVYVPLLPDEAQWAIGQLHPVAELPFSILLDEGFDTETYIDIFDGGPTVDARVAMLKTVRASRSAEWKAAGADAAAPASLHLLSNTQRSAWRALLTRAAWHGGVLALDPADAQTLALRGGQSLRFAPLHAQELHA
jgi:arginine N-succinyltransferase